MARFVVILMFPLFFACRTTTTSEVKTESPNEDYSGFSGEFKKQGFDAVVRLKSGTDVLGIWKKNSGLFEGKFASVASGNLKWQDSTQVFKVTNSIPFAPKGAASSCTAGLTGDCLVIYTNPENEIKVLHSNTAFENVTLLKNIWKK